MSKAKKEDSRLKNNYDKAIAHYCVTDDSCRETAKIFNIPKSSFHDYINRYQITKNPDAISAIDNLNKGFSSIEKLQNRALQNSESNPDKSGINPSLVVSEVLEIVKTKHPAFARSMQGFASKLLMKGFEALEKAKDPRDLNQLACMLEKINNTLQVIPKPPAIAQQFNFDKEDKTRIKENIKKIKFEINKTME